MTGRLFLVLAMLVATPALADDTANAKELYDRGVNYYGLQHWDMALEAFEAAWSIRHDPELMFNIAQCQRMLGQHAKARVSYRMFLASADPSSSAAALARRQAQEMEEAERTTAVRAHPVVAAAPSMPPAPQNVAHKTLAPRNFRRPLRLAGIATAGVGLGLVAAGAGFAAVSEQQGERAWHGDAYDYDADQRRAGFRAGAIASFVVGGAATATGITLWILGRRR
jgi:tetratricopeptide (TPR) repeat protein